MMINKVRYDYVRGKIDEFIIEFKIKKLPIDPFQIIKHKKWTLRTYEFYARKHKVSIKNISEAFGSQDGFTIFANGLYSIAYNNRIKSFGRIRFTLMHEIGHIYLRHLEEFNQTILTRGGLSQREYEILETEANIFASEILSPYQVLISLGWINYKTIAKHCGLSKMAAKTRSSQLFDLMINKVYIDENSIIYQNFYEFIYTKHCPICGYYFVSKDAKYCPICGNNKLIWGEGSMKYRKGIEIDNNGRALICPRCGNEEINKEDKYCKICGAYLIQICTSDYCDYKPAGNARYCPICGSITTFYEQDFLIPWEREKKELEAENRNLGTKNEVIKLGAKNEDVDIDFDFDFDEIDSNDRDFKESLPF